MIPRLLLLAAGTHFSFAASVMAQNSNGSFAVVEQGGTIGLGNVGTAGTAVAKDLIAGGAYPQHTIGHANDGISGNSNSWIGNSADSWVGIVFASSQSFAGIAWARDATGAFVDRSEGNYILEYSTDVNVLANPSGATWNTLAEVNYPSSLGIMAGSLLSDTAARHRYNFDSITATAVRIRTPDGAAIDELELFAGKVNAAGPASGIVTTAAPGYSILWDGNDGQHFSASGASVPGTNIALASNGATAFASSELGPQIGAGFHRAFNLNDGLYGNSRSWIGADVGGPAFAGVSFSGLHEITSVAWGRDNGQDIANGDVGQLTERWAGIYDIQITLDGTSWTSVGTVDLQTSYDDGIGGLASGYYRHEFDLTSSGGPILATGLRLMVPHSGMGLGTAIDELEVFGTPVPEAGGPMLLSLAALTGLWRRRA